MRRIGLEEAARQRWDVILAGSSFAACFFARGLRGRGLRVLMVERGPYVDRETQLAQRHSDRPPVPAQRNSSGQPKDWAVRHQFGGCSNCWWGNTPRLHPSDFALRSRHGVAADWPFGYDALEPFMAEAEAVMEVAGGGSEHIVPRSRPYPHPAHAPTRAERRLMELDASWVPMPTARANGGSRASCCAAGSCSLCPVDAKFTILNGRDAFADPDLSLVVEAECRRVETAAGRATGITVRDASGRETALRGDLIGLAANPIGNAAILLRSGIGGARVGEGLHEQAGQFAWIDVPFDNYYGGTSITGLGYAFYDGPFRSEAASVLLESWNAPPSLRMERGKWLQRLKLKLVAEDIPLARNRIVLEEDEPVIEWTGHSAFTEAGLARAREGLSGLLPFAERIAFGPPEPTEAHIIGGTPMGATAAEGVVDAECRLFDVPNVACLGAGAFPTGGAANPTLTLAALSLRLGERAA
ncbi:GMC oxidoreductase [Jannaschia sp. W003]|uniref:GMC oxidoreductase n=1 Tax=Jannaschia sp. W003 TaxID=2867012 RepID=UPI0021A75844|nr:GMC family oxidoreductase [Jannaschia sp. W003]UWQ21573.1 GMC family oxidoreductase [Jannaschia sp. W003]